MFAHSLIRRGSDRVKRRGESGTPANLLVDKLVASAAQVDHLGAVLAAIDDGLQRACGGGKRSSDGSRRRADNLCDSRLQISAAALYLVTTSGCR